MGLELGGSEGATVGSAALARCRTSAISVLAIESGKKVCEGVQSK